MKIVFLIAVLILLLPSAIHASPVVFHLTNGLTGTIVKIAAEDLGDGKDILAATSTGLFVIDGQGKLSSFYPTSNPITDFLVINRSAKDKTLVVSTTSQDFPNVVAYDPRLGKAIWDFKPEIPAFDTQLLWITKETKTWDLEEAQDLNNDQAHELLVASGSTVHMLDGKSGRPLWNFTATNDIWKATVSANIIVLGSQDGIIYALDSSGKLLWKNDLVPDFLVRDLSANRDVGIVKRSVWDILVADKVYVSAEDGYVYQLDKQKGDILDKRQVIVYDDNLLYSYYGADPGRLSPTGHSGSNFFNIQLQQLSESTIGVTTFMGSAQNNDNKGQGSYAITNRKLFLLSMDKLDVLQETAEIPLTDARQIFTHAGRLYVPAENEGSSQYMKSIDGAGKVQTFKFNTSSVRGKASSASFATGYDDKAFVFASDRGDLMLVNFNQTVRWAYPRYLALKTETVDINDDGVADLLVTDSENSDPNSPGSDARTRMMVVIDGKSQKMLWSYAMNYSEYAMTGGLQDLKVMGDANKDGYKEIVGFVQAPGDWRSRDMYGEDTRIIVFDGRTGTVLWRKPVVQNTYYGTYDAIFSDPTYMNRQLLSFNWTIIRLSAELNEAQTSLRYMAEDSPDRDQFTRRVETLQNQLDDATRQQADFQNRLADLSKREKELRVNKRITSIDTLDDQDHDGIPDLLVNCPGDVYVLSGSDAGIIWFRTRNPWLYSNMLDNSPANESLAWNFFRDEGDMTFRYLGDINWDHRPDFLGISYQKLMLVASSGTDNYSVSWTWQPAGLKYDSSRVALIHDFFGDNISDILLPVSSEGSPSTLKVIDSRQGKEVMSMPQDGATIEWDVADFNGDGSKDILLFQKWSNNGPTLQVISGKKGEVLFTYKGIDEAFMLEKAGYSEIMPATTAGDLNDDGYPDLVIAKTNMWSKGAQIAFVDVKNRKELGTYSFEAENGMGNDNRYQPAIRVQAVGDITKAGRRKVAVAGVFTDSYGQQESKVVILDIDERRIMKEYTLPADKVFGSRASDDVFITTKDGDIYLMDGSWSNPIKEPASGKENPGLVKVVWERQADTINALLVNGQEIMEPEGSEAELNLKDGPQEIALKTQDRSGNAAYDYVNVTIHRGKLGTTLINLIIALAVVSLIWYNVHLRRIKTGT